MEVYAQHGTLVASTVATVDLIGISAPILVTNRGSADIYVRFDGIDPTVGGDNTFIVPIGTAKKFGISGGLFPPERLVKLISTGTPAYSVEAV